MAKIHPAIVRPIQYRYSIDESKDRRRDRSYIYLIIQRLNYFLQIKFTPIGGGMLQHVGFFKCPVVKHIRL